MRRKLTSCRGLAALVTGASSGIGRLLALRLAAAGARVALTARRAGELEAVAAEIRAAGGEALVLPGDAAERDQVEAVCAQALARFGAVDILVNNAGYGHHRPFLEWDLADMERVMRVNYLGSLYFAKTLAPRMAERQIGWMVFMASVAGRIGTPGETAYAASKFALVGLAEALTLELAEVGIQVLTVCPGVIRTPFFDDEALARMPPVARRQMVAPEGLVEAILNALARGAHELTYPRPLAVAYLVRALAPGFMRRQVRRTTLGSLRQPDGRTGEPRI